MSDNALLLGLNYLATGEVNRLLTVWYPCKLTFIKCLMRKLFFLVIFAACNNPERDIQYEILTKFKENGGNIDARKLNSTAWDTMYILRPYADEKQFDSTLLKKREFISSTSISTRDDVILIMFFTKDHLSGSSLISRTRLDIGERFALPFAKISPYQTIVYTKDSPEKFTITGLIDAARKAEK